MKTTQFLAVALVAAASLSSAVAQPQPPGAVSEVPQVEERTSTPAIQQVLMSTVSPYPTVGLSEYTLVTDDPDRDRAVAEAVIQAKMGLPYAMHTKQREDFDRVLGRGFTFRTEDEVFDREGYIGNRIADPSRVRRVDYRNVAVQLIGDLALVTYANIVEDEPGGAGAWKADITWADVLAREDGEWKYLAVHLIEVRDLTTAEE